jgi:hypothetical protein
MTGLVERVAQRYSGCDGELWAQCGKTERAYYIESVEEIIRAILETHAIVPKEPTLAMCEAARTRHGENFLLPRQWVSILAAAPDPLKEK